MGENGITPLRLVVLGDSTAFTDHTGPQLPDHPALYPNVVARALRTALGRPVSVSVIAQAGSEVATLHRAILKDRHLQFEVLHGADAVVVAVGSFDHAPTGVPRALEALVPFIRPAPLRRRLRATLHALHPRVVRATGGRYARTPRAEFTRLYDRVLHQVRSLTQGRAAGVVLGPTGHDSAYFAHLHPHRESRERAQFAIARAHGFDTVACWPLVEPHRARLNPDGIHWPHEAHAAVGAALAEPLIEQLAGSRARPPMPAIR